MKKIESTPKPIGFSEYSKADKICQELFGVEFFNWLSFWERHHLNRKYKLNLNENDDFYERSEIQIIRTIKL
jgi:hypothetical protein